MGVPVTPPARLGYTALHGDVLQERTTHACPWTLPSRLLAPKTPICGLKVARGASLKKDGLAESDPPLEDLDWRMESGLAAEDGNASK